MSELLRKDTPAARASQEARRIIGIPNLVAVEGQTGKEQGRSRFHATYIPPLGHVPHDRVAGILLNTPVDEIFLTFKTQTGNIVVSLEDFKASQEK